MSSAVGGPRSSYFEMSSSGPNTGRGLSRSSYVEMSSSGSYTGVAGTEGMFFGSDPVHFALSAAVGLRLSGCARFSMVPGMIDSRFSSCSNSICSNPSVLVPASPVASLSAGTMVGFAASGPTSCCTAACSASSDAGFIIEGIARRISSRERPGGFVPPDLSVSRSFWISSSRVFFRSAILASSRRLR